MGVVIATTLYPPIGGKPSTVRVPIGRCPGRVKMRRTRIGVKLAYAPRCETSQRLPPMLSACYHPWRSLHSSPTIEMKETCYREDNIIIRALSTTVALLAAGFAAIQLGPQAVGQTGPGWVTLTDGKTVGDWNSTGEANWRIEDGALVADKGKGGHLVTKNSYKNFQINAEFWADKEANSGIF